MHTTTSPQQSISLRAFFEIAIIAAALLICSVTKAQTLVWQNNYNPAGYNTTGYNMVGHSTGMYTTSVINQISTSRKSLRIIKYSLTTGAEINSVTWAFGSSISSVLIAKTLVDASGNIYVFFRWTNSTTGRNDSFVVSYSPTLTLRWLNAINFDFNDDAADMVFTTGGNLLAMVNYAASGYTTGHIGIKQLSLAAGAGSNIVNFNFTSYKKRAYKLTGDASGNIFIAGYNQLLGVIDQQAMLVKYNSTGVYQWAHYYTLPGYVTGPLTDVFNDLITDNSGNVYAAGGGGSIAGSGKEGYIRKYSPSGALLNSHIYSTAQTDEIKFVKTDASGNIVVAGISGSNKVFTRKLNTSLATISTAINTMAEFVYSAGDLKDWLLCPNGSSLFLLNTFPNLSNPSIVHAYLVKLNSSGVQTFYTLFAGIAYQLSFIPGSNFPNNDFAIYLKYTSPGDLYIGRYSIAAAKLANDNALQTNRETKINIFPNPATSEIAINGLENTADVMLFDMQGKIVMQQKIYGNEKMDVSNLPRGTYFIKSVLEDGITASKKIVLQ